MLAETKRWLCTGFAIGMVACATVAEPNESREATPESTASVLLPVDESVQQEPDLPYREIMQRRAAAHRLVKVVESRPLTGVELERMKALNPRVLEAPLPSIAGGVVPPIGSRPEVVR